MSTEPDGSSLLPCSRRAFPRRAFFYGAWLNLRDIESFLRAIVIAPAVRSTENKYSAGQKIRVADLAFPQDVV